MPDNKNPNKDAIKAYKDSIRQAESGGNDSAKSDTSSATGRYQFTEATWKEMEKRLGRKLDIFKADDQEAAMNKLTEINVNALNKSNLPVTPANLYMTHFLGATGGPKFLKNLQDNPNELASKYVNASSVKANNNLFFKDNQPVTAAELYNTMSNKVGGNNQPIQQTSSQQEFRQPDVYRQTEIDNTSTQVPDIDPSLKRGRQAIPKQVTDNNDIRLNPVENTRNSLGLSSTLDFLPSDINLAFSEEEQLSEQLDNPNEMINVARDGGEQNPPKRKPTYKDSLDAYNRGEKNKKKLDIGNLKVKTYAFDKDDIKSGALDNEASKLYKETGILPSKEYVSMLASLEGPSGAGYEYGYNKPKGTKAKTIIPEQKRDKQKALNLKSKGLQEINNTDITSALDLTQQYIPTDFTISEDNQRMNNKKGYGTGRQDSKADINKAIRAKEEADRYNAEIERKYNNEESKKNPKARERYKTIKNNLTITPNTFESGGNMNTNKKTLSTGLLNEFNEGDSHEENKYGGIPQGIGENGKLNTVEEGETKFNNYVFSDTLKINENDIESLYLPKELKGMTFSEASKYINNVLKDNPNDNIIKKTINKQLDSLTLGNEKARLAKEELNINLNPASLIEDEANITEPNQMFLGGFGNMAGMFSGQQTEEPETESNSPINSNYMQVAGAGLNAIGDGKFEDRYNYDPELKANYQSLEKAKDGISSAIPVFGSFFRGVEKAGKGIGTAIGGETGGDVASGILDPFSGQMETFKNKESTGWEKAAVVAVPFLSGVIAGGARKRGQAKINYANSVIDSNKYSNDFKVGGDLDSRDPKYIPIPEDDLEFQGLDLSQFNDNNLNQVNTLNDNWYDSNPPYMSLDRENTMTPTTSNTNTTNTNNYSPKQKSMLQYAPVLGDYLNYNDARKEKPDIERLNRLSNRFNPNYVDEAYLQNIVSNDYDNTVNSLTNASNGSSGALRANIQAAGNNRTRALSDAYFKADDINRQQDLSGQQFNLGIDQFNTQQDNQERDINARNKAAVEDRKKASRDAIFRDLGSIGREETYDNRLYNLTGGYDSQGNYNPDNESYFDRLLSLAKDKNTNENKKGGTLSKLFEFSNKKNNKIDEEFNKRYR